MIDRSKGGRSLPPVTEVRADERFHIQAKNARLRQLGAKGIVADIRDLSRTGFRAEWPHGKNIGEKVWLTLPTLAPLAASVVRTNNLEIGCRFDTPMHPAIFDRVTNLSSNKPYRCSSRTTS